MAKNLLVINVDIRETRVALIENGIIAELHIERETSRGTLGNIYLGKVSRVLPGMQAAFIDVGLERAAFLHVEDLIRPDDFEAYLAGARRGPEEERPTTREDEGVEALPPPRPSAPLAAPPPAELEPEEQEREVDIELPTALDVQEAGNATSGTLAPEDVADDEVCDDEPLVSAGASDEGDDEPEAEAAGEDDGEDDVVIIEAAAVELSIDSDRVADSEDEPEETEGPADSDEIVVAAEGVEVAEAEVEAAGEGEPLEAAGEGELVEAAGEAPAGVALESAGELVRVPEEDAPVPRARGRRGRGRGNARVRRSGRTTDRQPQVAGSGEAQARPDQAPEQAPREQAERGPRGERPEQAPRGERSDRGRGDDRGARGGDQRRGRSDDRSARSGDQRNRGRSDKGRRDGREGRQDGRDSSKQGSGRDGRDQRDQRGDQRRGHHHEPPRISKSTPIREVIREGQEVLVQISKEPIGTKGARVTSHISLAGRYVVYLPTVDHVGISKRIGSDKERGRLREAIEAMKPPQGGLIVRTVAEGLTKKQLKADVGYLVRLWGEVVKKRETGVRAPAGLYTELDLVLKTARDLFTDDIEKIVIDSREEYERLRRFLEVFLPERIDDIELYQGEEPIFDAYGIEDEIQRAQSRKVPLPSGGYLIIDQAEALTAIDVNTGRFVGKGSKDLEETILATNLEAVEEIAYQLRFRNIGGLIILDLIDMERASNREKVRKRLEELLSRDKAKTTLNRISDLGLIEMTRKRTRESLGRIVLEPCFYCDGTGQLQSKQTIAYEILRQIRRERMNLPGYVIVVNAHPAVVDLLKSDERVAVTEAERLFQRRIELVPRKEYHLEQFDLQGR
ncbi:Cytoplasmic axial filament protein CafA and Ribonuclease G [Minicystis rosea]|nr:Cytoplasmic axial filament protein CafA and Ribonuclease G [Minicystis rosea]